MFLFFVGQLLGQKSGLVYPKDEQILQDTTITLMWDESPKDSIYHLTLASDSLFQNIIINSQAIIDNRQLTTLSTNQTYFWFVNYPSSNINSDTFQVAVFNPKNIDSLILWLSVDSLVVSDSIGKVSQWGDLSGNGNNCLQNFTGSQPIYLDSVWLNHKGIYFDNSNLLGSFSDSLNFLNQSLFFLQMNDGSQQRQTPFGYFIQNTPSYVVFDFEIWAYNGRFTLWFGDYSSYETSHNNLNLSNRFELAELIINNQNVNLFHNANNVSSFNISLYPNKVINYILGTRFPGGNALKGHIPEILLYSKSLNPAQRKQVENYLLHKYTPPVNLGPNILRRYSFCDTTLTTEVMYESYLWSTGDTTREISISRQDTGWYWVEVPNLFGDIMRDSIYVYNFVPEPGLIDTTICLGTPSDIQLPYHQGYSFLWSDSSTNSALQVSQPGQYTVVVTDSFGCSVYDTVMVHVDSFAVQAGLGADTSLCTGDRIGLQTGRAGAEHFLWSTGSQDSLLQIHTAGTYSVEVTNTTGCVARDTITVDIQGITPAVGFTTDSTCLGNFTVFQDTSFTLDNSNIISKTWDFGDNSSLSHSVDSSLSHQYASPGDYTVKLTATTDSGCTNFAYRNAWVHPLPKADFKPLTACSGHELAFEDRSQRAFGDLQQWRWGFNDPNSSNDTSSQQEPVYVFDRPGLFDVQQVVIDEYGCRDTALQAVNIRPSPEADFHFSNTCNGSPVFFTSQAQDTLNAITHHNWQFTPTDSSSLRNPHFLFDSDGSFPVNYYVRSLNGCWDTITKDVAVHPLPLADFAMQTYCLDDTAVFADQSTVPSGSIHQWRWDFGNGTTGMGSTGVTVYQDTLEYPVTLLVTTDEGCRDTLTQMAKVNPNPQAAFTTDLRYGLPPLQVQFSNNSSGASDYHWAFGDGHTSSLPAPQHTFQDTGVFHTLMTAYNDFGCTDTQSTKVFAVYKPIDLVLTAGFIQLDDGYVSYQCRVYNQSQRPVQRLLLEAGINNRYSLRETWTGSLQPGQTLNYSFTAQTPVDQPSDVNYFCFKVTPDVGQKDINPEKNELCEEYTEELWVSKPYPNPAGDRVNLDVIVPYAQTVYIQLYDSKGSKLNSFGETLSKGLNTLEFSTEALNQGAYFMHLRLEEEVRVLKFVK